MAAKPVRIGAVQLQIMRVLWARGRVTAREITDELSRYKRIAHSTVQTLLRKLEAKGAVGHEVKGRTFVFHPLVTEAEVCRSATRELLSRIFDGSAVRLVAHLVKHEDISPEELGEIHALIEEAEGKQ